MSEIIDQLREVFPEVQPSLISETVLGSTPVFVFVVPDANYLAEKWEKIRNVVAAGYQGNLKRDQLFEKWNVYIFYICGDEVPWQLRGIIENDKFSSRKIVISGPEARTDIALLIGKYITGAEIVADVRPDGPNGNGRKRNGSAEHASPPGFVDDAATEIAISPAGRIIKDMIGGDYIEDRYRKDHRKRLENLLRNIETKFKQ